MILQTGKKIDQPSPSSIQSHRVAQFTLLELLVVLLIIGAALALVGPRIGQLPSRLVIRNSTTGLLMPFSEAGLRSRSTGQPVSLLLKPERNTVILLDGVLNANQQLSDDYFDRTGDAQKTENPVFTYDLSEHIEWMNEHRHRSIGKGYVFNFFPDGDAVGPTIDFAIRGRFFRLSVTRLTGKANISEY